MGLAHHGVPNLWEAVPVLTLTMPGWFDVVWLACGLLMVPSWLPQLFGWCVGVLAALWSFIIGLFPLQLALSCPRLSC